MVKSPFADCSATHRSLMWNKKTSNTSLSLRITSGSFTGSFATQGQNPVVRERGSFQLNLSQVRKLTFRTIRNLLCSTLWNTRSRRSQILSHAMLYLARHVWETATRYSQQPCLFRRISRPVKPSLWISLAPQLMKSTGHAKSGLPAFHLTSFPLPYGERHFPMD
jgi:hypothetical protein